MKAKEQLEYVVKNSKYVKINSVCLDDFINNLEEVNY